MANEANEIRVWLVLARKAATIQPYERADTRQLMIQFDKVLKHLSAAEDALEAALAAEKARADKAEAEVARMREALKPFAQHPDFHAPDDWAVTQLDNGEPEPAPGVTAGDFRRARAALENRDGQ